MSSEVPPEFDKPWSMSDVILRTSNSEGKEIHACKAALALFSPYFRALFFGDFKEKNDNTADVNCDYDVFLEILKNIHHINYEYAVGQKPYSSDMIVKMYEAADQFDFSIIRKLCLDHMEGYASIEMAKAAGHLELFDVRMNIWMKLTREDLHKFLHLPGNQYNLTKGEFRILFEKVVGQPLPNTNEAFSGVALNLEEITEDLENPRVDLTKSWPGADLAIITAKSRGKVLYANKSVVETMCHNLHKYLFTTDELLLEGPKRHLARIEKHYITVKEILSLIHNCNTNFRKERVLHPVLLFDMYSLAMEEQLDIPFVRDWCVAKLMEHKSVDAVDALASLELEDSSLIEACEMLLIAQLRDWMYRKEGHLCYHDGAHDDVFASPDEEEEVIDEKLTCWLIQKFKEEFFCGT